MSRMLHFMALLIFLHNMIGLWGLLRQRQIRRDLLSLLFEGLMASLTILAVIVQKKIWLLLGFAGYRTLIILESAWINLRKQRPPSPVLPANLLVVGAALLSFWLDADWIFVIGYVIFWALSWWTARRMMHRAPIS